MSLDAGVARREGKVSLQLLPFDSGGSLTVRRALEPDRSLQIPLRVQSGGLQLSLPAADAAAPVVQVDGGEIRLEDVVVDAEALPPSGLILRELRLSLVSPGSGSVTWLRSEGTLALSLDFVLRGELETASGAKSPFEPVSFDDVRVDAALSERPGEPLEARARCDREGLLWSWGGLVEATAFSLHVRGLESEAP